MRGKLTGVMCLAAVLIAGGCARDVETEVTRFHQGHLPAGESFAVLPEEDIAAGPEFDRYADMIAEELATYGYSRAMAGEADLHVLIDYNVSEGRTRIESRPGFSYPHYSYLLGFHHRPFHYGFYHPYRYDGYLGPDIRSKTIHTRRLAMTIRNAGTGETVFEGRALSEGPTQEIARIMPYLVESMFRNFPGDSGTTKVVKIETKNGSRY